MISCAISPVASLYCGSSYRPCLRFIINLFDECCTRLAPFLFKTILSSTYTEGKSHISLVKVLAGGKISATNSRRFSPEISCSIKRIDTMLHFCVLVNAPIQSSMTCFMKVNPSSPLCNPVKFCSLILVVAFLSSFLIFIGFYFFLLLRYRVFSPRGAQFTR